MPFPRSGSCAFRERATRPRSTPHPFILGLIALLGTFVGLARESSAQVVLEHYYVTNGTVSASALSGNTLYIGGSFTEVGPATGGGVSIDASSGLPIGGIGAIAKVAGSVLAVAPDGTGGWFIGGTFSTVGGVARSNLAHVLSDNSVASWNPGADATVFTLTVSGSTVYIGGSFSNVGGQARNRIAALDAGTGSATAWNPNATAPAAEGVHAIAVSGSTVYVGGVFTAIGGQARNDFAALDATTGLATAWNPNGNGAGRALVVSGSIVYAGGSFTNVGGQARNRIAALDATTGLATSLNLNANNTVYALILNGSTLYLGGTFFVIGGQTRYRIASVDLTSGLVTPWDPKVVGDVNAMALNGSTLYVGGNFNSVGLVSRDRLAAVDVSTGLATAWDPHPNQSVMALATSGSAVFAGGTFSSLAAQPRNHLAAIDVTTGGVTSWAPDAASPVTVLAVGHGVIYAVGGFVVGDAVRYVVAIDVNGNLTGWNPDPDGLVQALRVDSNLLYIGGSFTHIDGVERDFLAALDVDGVATSWNPAPDGPIYSIAVGGGGVFLGGDFGHVGGQARSDVAKLDPATGLATSWAADLDIAPNVVVAHGSYLYIGGAFDLVGGVSRHGLAAVDVLTAAVSPWDPNPDAGVLAITVDRGIVSAGGVFTTMGGSSRRGVAQVDSATGLPNAFNPSPVGSVSTIVMNGTKVYLGGTFGSIGGSPQTHFAAIGPMPVSIGDLVFAEGNSVNTSANLTVRIPKPLDQPVTVHYQTSDGSATLADGDYVSTSGTATIAAFDTVGFASVPVIGDRKHEPNETFTVTITNPTNAEVLDATGQVTIANDDPIPSVSIGDVTIAEGNSGTRNAIFAISLSNPTIDDVTVDFHTEDGTATLANHDYVFNSGNILIPSATMSATVTVLVNGDRTFEADETFNVVLTNPQNATLGDATGQCTITSGSGIHDGLYVTNGSVNATAVSGNTLYIGGSFTRVGPATGSAAPIDTSSGLPVAGFPKVIGTVQTIVADGSGGWYIGGSFSSIGGQARSNLAHVGSNLAVLPWAPNANAVVNAIAVSGGIVYVGGSFSGVGGEMRNRIAALDATTGLATTWNPNASNTVFALVVNGGTVYAGGAFSVIGGSPRSFVAAIDATTGLATAWNPGAGYLVRTLLVSGSMVYAGGDFTSIGGQTRNYIAAVDATTGLATAWNPNASNSVMAMALSGSTLYVGGGFSTVGGQTRHGIAALSTVTGSATSWNPDALGIGAGVVGTVVSLGVSGATVYVGGLFQTIGGQSRSYLAALDATTGLATAWNPSPSGQVNALAISGTTVYAGGSFSSLGGQARNNLAALDLTTGLPTSWNPGVSGSGSGVSALLVDGPRVYVGGNFTYVGGSPRNSVAALDVATGLATSWDPNVQRAGGVGGSVYSLAVSGSTVYLGGLFEFAGVTPRGNVAAVDATTGLATSWNPSTDGTVNAMVLSGPNIYLGGAFVTVGGQTRRGIAAVDLATGLPTAWNPDATGGGGVSALAPGGAGLYVGGFFTNIGGQSRKGIAELDLSTGLATAWNPGPLTSSAHAFSFAPLGGTVYVGGSFISMGGQTRNNFAALDAASGLALGLDPSPNGTVSCIVASDSLVLFGGFFSSAGGLPQSNLVGIGVVEEPPLVSINDVTVTEGDAGTTVANLTLGLSGLIGFPVTVQYQTQDGTATLANADYVEASGTATIDPKTMSATLPIQINADTKHEADETLTVTISSPTNATLGRATGQITIVNDDGTPGLGVRDLTIAEGASGSTDAVFTIKLSHPTDQIVTVQYQTQDGSATVTGNDYTATSGTATIDAKAESTTVAVAVNGDLTPELAETFSLVLSLPTNATVDDSAGVCTITNDDGPLGVPDLPRVFELRSGAPNPFSRSTVMGFDLPRAVAVWLRVYDVRGRLVRTLVNGSEQPAGRHQVTWDAIGSGERRAGAGVYFCEMIAPGFRKVRRVVLLP